MSSVLRMSSANTARTKPTTGDTKTSFVDVDHLGWIKCDGRGLNTTMYNLLFQVIGYTFGGSGATFQLPDPRGRVIGNKGTIIDTCNPSGLAFPSGTVTGEISHKLTIAEMPAHNHNNATGTPGANVATAGTTSSYTHDHGTNTSSYTHNHGGSTGEGGNRIESENVNNVLPGANVSGEGTHTHSIANDTHSHTITADTHSHTIASNGGDACHNNMQPTLFYGNMFIYSGIPMNGTFPFTTGISPVLI